MTASPTSVSSLPNIPALPTGTVTFLFTDIAGSTRLWEAHPDPMREALRRHDQLIRDAVESNNGVVFRTVGDAFCCAFAVASDAIRAAVRAQVRLQAEPWPEETPILVRMAVHVGAVEQEHGDYVGAPLNRIARLLATAHAAQIVVSQAVYELVRDHPDGDTTLLPLGIHRLKDLSRPETVYQVAHTEITGVFPPLRSLGSPDLPNNLPESLTSFVGRTREIAEVERLLSNTRLLSLLGPGGVGKTRLSLQVGAGVLERYEHGVWVVELADLTSAEQVVSSVARVLSVRDTGTRSTQDAVFQALADKNLLLLLDNCEHLIEDCARFVQALLSVCPKVSVLATSREPLNIPGEQIYRLAPLPVPKLPEESADPSTPHSLSQFESVRLFIERAQLQRADFAVTNDNAPYVAELCHRLDGIPLAIELAAGRLRAMSVEEITARLGERFRLLTGGNRTMLPRQQTLRALVDWSYDLLSEPERMLLRRLSVFVGGAGLPAIETVCADDALDALDIFDLLSELVAKSLVVHDDSGETSRYRLLETVREYAGAKLREAGEEGAFQDRLVEWAVRYAEQRDAEFTVAHQETWRTDITREYSNLRVVLEKGGEPMLRVCAAVWRVWHMRGAFREGLSWCETSLRVSGGDGAEWDRIRTKLLIGGGWIAQAIGEYANAREWLDEARAICIRQGDSGNLARALNIAGLIDWNTNDLPKAQSLFEESIRLFREQGNTTDAASPLNNLGSVSFLQGDLVTAQACFAESSAIMESAGDLRGAANALSNLAIVVSGRSDYDAAERYMREGLEVRRRIGDVPGIANSLHNLGAVNHYRRNYDAARPLFEEALLLRRKIGEQRGVASTLRSLGAVELKQGDLVRARDLFAESLTIFRRLGERLGILQAIEAWNLLLSATGDVRAAARGWGLVYAVRREMGTPFRPEDAAEIEETIASERARITPEQWDVAWAEGETMSLDTLMNLLLGR